MPSPLQSLRPLLLTPLLLGAITCAKPKERPKVDKNLATAFRLAESDPDAALAALEKVDKGESSQIAYVRGLAFESKHDLTAAADSFRKAVQLDPGGPEPKTALARVQLLLGDEDQARQHLRSAIRGGSGDLLPRLLLAICAQTSDEKSEAKTGLTSWAGERDSGEKTTPLRAEYFLTVAAMEEKPLLSEKARYQAQSAELGEVDAALSLAHFARLQGKFSLARDLLDKLAASAADELQLAQVAESALAIGSVKTATRALTRIPKNVRTRDLLTLRGRVELAKKNPKRALGHFKAATKLTEPQHTKSLDEVEFLTAKAYALDKSDQQAQEILRRILRRSPTHRASHVLAAQIEMSTDQLDQALSRLTRLTSEFAKDTGLHHLLAKAFAKKSEHRSALATYEKIASINPGDARALIGQAETKRAMGDSEGALQLFLKAEATFPGELELVRAVCAQYLRMKRPEDALRFARGSDLSSKRPVGVGLLIADLFDTLEKESDVRRTLETLVEKNPTSARAWSALARVEQREHKFQALEVALRKSIELDPNSMKDKARLASLLAKLGKDKEAATLFGELGQSTGKDLVALNNAAMLYSDELGDPERAVAFAEKAYKLAPELPAVLDTLAWALYRRGSSEDLKRALALLKRARSKRQSPESSYHYGAILMKSGQKQEGEALIRNALNSEEEPRPWKKKARDLLGE